MAFIYQLKNFYFSHH